MRWLQDMPVKRRLTLIILGTCTAVLLLDCGMLAAYEAFDFHRAMVRDMAILADVFGKNTRAALAFQDEKAARETMLALRAEPAIEAACLYAADGSPFANYIRPGAKVEFPSRPAAEGHRFVPGRLVLVRSVSLANGKPIGAICLWVDLRGLHERLLLFGGIAGLVLLGSLLVALALSSRLQRPISRPILALAETAKLVAENNDFTVRAATQGKDEIGILTSAFNRMLGAIEERERALRSEIAERKSAEDKVHSQLARLELLNQITRAIGERLDLGGVFHVALENLEKHLPVDFALVCVYDGAKNTLTISSIGSRSQKLAGELDMGGGYLVAVDQNGLSKCIRGHLVNEPDISRVEFPFPQRLARGGLRSLVLAPLLVESKVFGVLIAARQQPESFGSGECEFVRQLSEHVALAAHQSQLYAALQQAYDDLRQTQQAIIQQERMRALGEMASGIAHDINNAITPAGIYAELILEDETNLSARARQLLTTISHAIADVAQTVARMGEFYRQREPQLAFAPLELNSLIQEVVDLTRVRWNDMPQAQGLMIALRKELTADLPAVPGVGSEIREALINLVFNAVDAMPNGGTLTLRTKIAGGVSEKDGVASRIVQVEVSDTGTGMDEETRRRCLEPFFTTKGQRGTGLGLAMVYGILRRHNADLAIESAPGKGTTMRLSFVVPTAVAAGSTGTAVTCKTPSRLRILVVDDDPLLINSLRDALEHDGHVLVTANGGQAGIDAFRRAHEKREPFAVVITDLGMPYVDGRKVSSAIKNLSPSTPVILLTGWGQRLATEGDVPAHVDCVLNKPPKLLELRQALVRFSHDAK